MSSLPPYYEQSTVGGDSATAPATTATTTSTTQDLSSKSHTTDTHTTQTNSDAISPAPAAATSSTFSTSTPTSAYEPTTEISQPRGSLSSTTGPFQVPTTDDVSKKDSALTSSVGQQSAPGRAGSIGEKTLSAFGYGGSKVERPKEDQGLGEKIVNFLGA